MKHTQKMVMALRLLVREGIPSNQEIDQIKLALAFLVKNKIVVSKRNLISSYRYLFSMSKCAIFYKGKKIQSVVR